MNHDLATLTDLEGLGKLAKTATSLFESGLLPKSIKSSSAAMAIMLRGMELGIPPVASLSTIHVVEGKTELSGTALQAILQRAGIAIQTVKSTAEIAVVRMSRKVGDFAVTEEYEFTIGEAKTAGLTGKDNWRGYAKDMLYWRAISRGARRIGADVAHGVYVEGELADAPPVVAFATSVPETPAAPVAQIEARPTYEARIAEATDAAALLAVGADIAQEPAEIRARVSAAYESRRTELTK